MKWLNKLIDARVKYNDDVNLKYIRQLERFQEDTLRDLAHGFIFAILSKKKLKTTRFSYNQLNTLRGDILDSVETHLAEKYDNLTKKKALDIVKGEEFLDDVIKRIKDKQLP